MQIKVISGPLASGKTTYKRSISKKPSLELPYGVDVTKDGWWEDIVEYAKSEKTDIVETHLDYLGNDVDDGWFDEMKINSSKVILPPPGLLEFHFVLPDPEELMRRQNERGLESEDIDQAKYEIYWYQTMKNILQDKSQIKERLLRQIIREEIKKPSVWYSGVGREDFKFLPNRTAWFTKDKSGAEWYAERNSGEEHAGFIVTASINNSSPADEKVMLEIVKDLELDPDDLSKYSPYFSADENVNDWIYYPQIQQELEKRGYDSYTNWDYLENGEIEILVVWNPSLIKVTQVEEVENDFDQWFASLKK